MELTGDLFKYSFKYCFQEIEISKVKENVLDKRRRLLLLNLYQQEVLKNIHVQNQYCDLLKKAISKKIDHAR